MKLLSVFVCTFLVAISPVHADNADAISSAKGATLAWLALADQGRYEESWNSAALMFQAAITQSDWDRSLNAVRTPLGGVMTREVGSSTFATTLPGASSVS